MRIALTPEEFVEYGTLGLQRLSSALEKRRVGAHGFNRNAQERYRIDIEGLHAEYVAAKALNLLPFTPCVGELDSAMGDIGPGLQVRSTKYSSGSLLIHDSDDDDHIFILVTGELGVFDVRGWIYARDGKKKSLWKDYKGRGAYWVPQSKLRKLDTLPLPETP
jgi:hypothetical protein